MQLEYIYCTKEEAIERQRVTDIHPLEATDETSSLITSKRVYDPTKVVKKFNRSGTLNLHSSSTIRTTTQLNSTVDYLFYNIWLNNSKSDQFPLEMRYSFIMDRLRAIQQEIFTNEMISNELAYLLYKICNFYINCLYICSNNIYNFNKNYAGSHNISFHKSNWFDFHLHESAIQSCIASTITMCKAINNNYKIINTSLFISNNSISNSVEPIVINTICYNILLRISISIKEIFRELNNSTPEILSKLSSVKLSFIQDEMIILINSKNFDDNHFIKLILNLIEAIKQHNPSKFIKSYKYCLDSNNSYSNSNNGFKLSIIALLLYMLPEIRIWRILLIERSSCKGDKISSVLLYY